MWNELPLGNKNEYKRWILAFASLSEVFSQKSDDETIAPIINSKYQETVFQKAFNASAEDIGNTSYDVAIRLEQEGLVKKYLIGIKTFGIQSGDQKIAQFKAYNDDILQELSDIRESVKGKKLTEQQINEENEERYLVIAKKISSIRNQRIESSIENLKGFKVNVEDNIESVYHVLMPSKKGQEPQIFVGETSYNKIDIDNLNIIGCTGRNNPTNFTFSDGIHKYKFTPADCQLYMSFDNSNIVVDTWDVIYADNAYDIFSEIGNKVYGEKVFVVDSVTSITPDVEIEESVSWSLLNNKGEVEMFSGFNSFYGVGSKLSKSSREIRCIKLLENYKDAVEEKIITDIYEKTKEYLLIPSPTREDKYNKVKLREEIIKICKETQSKELLVDLQKLLYRPMNEIYIPIPNHANFHRKFPNMFGGEIGKFEVEDNSHSEKFQLCKNRVDRTFNLVFEPSGDSITSFVAQDGGKAIESVEKQSYLGEWILRKVFQLDEYEVLTAKRLYELEINGIRLHKEKGSDDVHIKFIWIDDEDKPYDFFE